MDFRSETWNLDQEDTVWINRLWTHFRTRKILCDWDGTTLDHDLKGTLDLRALPAEMEAPIIAVVAPDAAGLRALGQLVQMDGRATLAANAWSAPRPRARSKTVSRRFLTHSLVVTLRPVSSVTNSLRYWSREPPAHRTRTTNGAQGNGHGTSLTDGQNGLQMVTHILHLYILCGRSGQKTFTGGGLNDKKKDLR